MATTIEISVLFDQPARSSPADNAKYDCTHPPRFRRAHARLVAIDEISAGDSIQRVRASLETQKATEAARSDLATPSHSRREYLRLQADEELPEVRNRCSTPRRRERLRPPQPPTLPLCSHQWLGRDVREALVKMREFVARSRWRRRPFQLTPVPLLQ